MSKGSIIGFGVAGAVSASLECYIGAAVLHDAGYDVYDGKVQNAAIEGLVGGAIVCGGLGLLAALARGTGRQELSGLAGSSLVSGLTGGVVGTAVLKATGHAGHLKEVSALAAGAVGVGVITGATVALLGAAALILGTGACCVCLLGANQGAREQAPAVCEMA